MDVRLLYFRANGQRREMRLHSGVVVVGRGEDCQLRIPAETVSRRHCQIEVSANKVVLSDLGSSNGTIVKGERLVDDQAELQAGDQVVIGPATFTVQIDGKPGKLDAAQQPAVEEQLTGSTLSDDTFDPFSVLEDLVDEVEQGQAPQPKQMPPAKRPPEGSGPDKAGPKGNP